MIDVALNLNGTPVLRSVEPRRLLSDFIREDLGHTGTHVGCEQGYCGACTVLLNGEPVRSCLMFAFQAGGRAVETVESLAISATELHPIQHAFWDKHALQCGFCTPGMLMATKAMLASNPDPTEEEVRHDLSANMCRCTGYGQIVDAVLSAGAALRETS